MATGSNSILAHSTLVVEPKGAQVQYHRSGQLINTHEDQIQIRGAFVQIELSLYQIIRPIDNGNVHSEATKRPCVCVICDESKFNPNIPSLFSWISSNSKAPFPRNESSLETNYQLVAVELEADGGRSRQRTCTRAPPLRSAQIAKNWHSSGIPLDVERSHRIRAQLSRQVESAGQSVGGLSSRRLRDHLFSFSPLLPDLQSGLHHSGAGRTKRANQSFGLLPLEPPFHLVICSVVF